MYAKILYFNRYRAALLALGLSSEAPTPGSASELNDSKGQIA